MNRGKQLKVPCLVRTTFERIPDTEEELYRPVLVENLLEEPFTPLASSKERLSRFEALNQMILMITGEGYRVLQFYPADDFRTCLFLVTPT